MITSIKMDIPEEEEDSNGGFTKSKFQAWGNKAVWSGFGKECKTILLLASGLVSATNTILFSLSGCLFVCRYIFF